MTGGGSGVRRTETGSTIAGDVAVIGAVPAASSADTSTPTHQRDHKQAQQPMTPMTPHTVTTASTAVTVADGQRRSGAGGGSTPLLMPRETEPRKHSHTPPPHLTVPATSAGGVLELAPVTLPRPASGGAGTDAALPSPTSAAAHDAHPPHHHPLQHLSGVFDAAQLEVYRVLASDPFPRFKASPPGRECAHLWSLQPLTSTNPTSPQPQATARSGESGAVSIRVHS